MTNVGWCGGHEEARKAGWTEWQWDGGDGAGSEEDGG